MPSCRICFRVQARLNCFKLNCSKLKEDKSCSKCYEDDKEVTDYGTTEFIIKDEFISNEILSNISAKEREFIVVIKERMLEEKHRIHVLQSNYIDSLKDRIACLHKDVEFFKKWHHKKMK